MESLRRIKFESRLFLQSALILAFMAVSSAIGAATYYSQGTGSFSTLSNWNSASNGSGTSPTAADLISGLHDFIVQNGHTVTVDQDILVNDLTVGSGASGALVIGNSTTADSVTVNGTLTVSNSASLSIGAFNAIHTVIVKSGISNSGSLDLYTSSSQAASLVLDGTQSISGNSPQVYNVTFSSGTTTANVGLDIEGSLTLETSTVFAAGSHTHNVAGNWIESGSGQMTSSGTIQFDAPLVQSIPYNAVFNHVVFNGGGIVTLSGNINAANFSVSNNTTVRSTRYHTITGNMTVANGSDLEATAGRFTFNSSSAQELIIGSNASFRDLYFDNGGSGNAKTVVGVLDLNGTLFVYNDAHLSGSGNHQLRTVRLDGTISFPDTVTLGGGTIYNNSGGSMSFGNAAIMVEGYVSINSGDTLNVNEDVRVNSGYLIINNNSALIQHSANKLFELAANRNLYVRGANCFPSGFDSVNLDRTSFVRYDANMKQTVASETYGHLYVARDTAIAAGNLNIEGHLYLRNTVYFNMGAHDHTIGRDISNGTSSDGSILSTGSVTLDGDDINQYINNADAGSYTFKRPKLY